jgi:uncharacterized protein YeaC (DUF1315 family)
MLWKRLRPQTLVSNSQVSTGKSPTVAKLLKTKKKNGAKQLLLWTQHSNLSEGNISTNNKDAQPG